MPFSFSLMYFTMFYFLLYILDMMWHIYSLIFLGIGEVFVTFVCGYICVVIKFNELKTHLGNDGLSLKPNNVVTKKQINSYQKVKVCTLNSTSALLRRSHNSISYFMVNSNSYDIIDCRHKL